jgi:hypothetical protein
MLSDLELANKLTIYEIQKFAPSAPELKLAVVVGLKAYDAAEFVNEQPSVRYKEVIGDGTEGAGDMQLHDPNGVAFVPTHPELIIVTTRASQSLRIYDLPSKTLLCKVGRRDGQTGEQNGEFKDPYGVAITADAAHVFVADHENNRVQVFKLVVQAGRAGAGAGLAGAGAGAGLAGTGAGAGLFPLSSPRMLSLTPTSQQLPVKPMPSGGAIAAPPRMSGTAITASSRRLPSRRSSSSSCGRWGTARGRERGA